MCIHICSFMCICDNILVPKHVHICMHILMHVPYPCKCVHNNGNWLLSGNKQKQIHTLQNMCFPISKKAASSSDQLALRLDLYDI